MPNNGSSLEHFPKKCVIKNLQVRTVGWNPHLGNKIILFDGGLWVVKIVESFIGIIVKRYALKFFIAVK